MLMYTEGKILLIDNYDSFTYNLFQVIKKLGFDVLIIRNDELTLAEIDQLKFDKIIISPGPSKPTDSGISVDLVKKYYKTVPILGVCLGMQIIAHAFGVDTIKSTDPAHGKTANLNIINRDNSILYKKENIPEIIKVMRYHSLIIEKTPKEFNLTSNLENSNDNDYIIMSIEHKKYHLAGVQYHPESFLTEYGETIIENFLNAVKN